MLGFAFANAAESAALNVLGPIVAKESLGGASVWGLVLAATGVGLVIGSLIALRIRPERPLFVGVVAITLLFPPLVLLAIEAPWPVIAASALLAGHRDRALLRLLGHLAAGARPERGALPRLGVGCDRVARADSRRLRDRRPARGRDRDRGDALALRRASSSSRSRSSCSRGRCASCRGSRRSRV